MVWPRSLGQRQGWWARVTTDLRQDLVEQIGSFALDPPGFVLFAFPWGDPGTVLADVAGPRQWQRELLAELGSLVNLSAFIKITDRHRLPEAVPERPDHGLNTLGNLGNVG